MVIATVPLNVGDDYAGDMRYSVYDVTVCERRSTRVQRRIPQQRCSKRLLLRELRNKHDAC